MREKYSLSWFDSKRRNIKYNGQLSEWFRYQSAKLTRLVRFQCCPHFNGELAQLVSARILYIQGCRFKSYTLHNERKKIPTIIDKKGFETVYIAINKEPRRVAALKHVSDKKISMSYAKYIYTSYYQCDVDKDNHVAHIMGTKWMIELKNLQVISAKYNTQKDHKKKRNGSFKMSSM